MVNHAPLAHHIAQYAHCGGCRPALADGLDHHGTRYAASRFCLVRSAARIQSILIGSATASAVAAINMQIVAMLMCYRSWFNCSLQDQWLICC